MALLRLCCAVYVAGLCKEKQPGVMTPSEYAVVAQAGPQLHSCCVYRRQHKLVWIGQVAT
jgi:hypothetical protein